MDKEASAKLAKAIIIGASITGNNINLDPAQVEILLQGAGVAYGLVLGLEGWWKHRKTRKAVAQP